MNYSHYITNYVNIKREKLYHEDLSVSIGIYIVSTLAKIHIDIHMPYYSHTRYVASGQALIPKKKTPKPVFLICVVLFFFTIFS